MRVTHCRLCKNGALDEPALSFPPTPLANEFLSEAVEQDVFPLEVAVCNACGHYQLTESVDPDRLFTTYSYAAGHSKANIAHFDASALHHIEKLQLAPESRVLDIASNDGTLLKAFARAGMRVLGIDPAQNLAEEANRQGVPTIADFFTAARAESLRAEHGQFDLVTANNVFAHVPDLKDFATGVRTMLAPEGVFSFEVSYFFDVCEKALFDTIYHEHSSYHTIAPLIPFFSDLGMKVMDVEHLPNHGGSVRVYVTHADAARPAADISAFLNQESDMPSRVELLKDKIDRLKRTLKESLETAKAQGKSIAVYGAPAKATTLTYAFGLDSSLIDFAVDDEPLKQGTYTPGTHIPILPSAAIYERNPDVLLVLAWNFADTIIEQHPNFTGTWIIPLPELRILT